MNPGSLLLFFGHKLEQQTVTFNTNTTWPAPSGVNLLVTVSGHGADGTTTTIDGYYDPDVTTYELVKIGQISYPDNTASDPFEVSRDPATATSTIPASYCENQRPNGETWCYGYVKESTTTPGAYHPPHDEYTTGASATGFGKTFAGGYGGAASTVTYNNVAVTPGTSYTIVVPSSATIQITYFA